MRGDLEAGFQAFVDNYKRCDPVLSPFQQTLLKLQRATLQTVVRAAKAECCLQIGRQKRCIAYLGTVPGVAGNIPPPQKTKFECVLVQIHRLRQPRPPRSAFPPPQAARRGPRLLQARLRMMGTVACCDPSVVPGPAARRASAPRANTNE